ncbi:hypothetical protein FAM8407_00228 [Lacticaseibacillus paracasei]|nr:hypothetical protein FAM8407_00228 [Lacticaseibacillus paracasei]
MATLTQDMKDMIGAQLNYLATADENGNPQVGPPVYNSSATP